MIFPKIIECPYMPPGFIAMEDASGIVVGNTATGYVFRLPKIELLPDSGKFDNFRHTENGVAAWDLVMKYRLIASDGV